MSINSAKLPTMFNLSKFVALFFVLLSMPALAQQKMQVRLLHSQSDAVGVAVAAEIRRQIQQSRDYVIVPSEPFRPSLALHIASLPVFNSDPAAASALSVASAFTLNEGAGDVLMQYYVTLCSADRVKICADSAMEILKGLSAQLLLFKLSSSQSDLLFSR